jgi:hypothetical protein
MIGVEFLKDALPILERYIIRQIMPYVNLKRKVCIPLSNRTVWRTEVPVNGSAVLARGQVMEYANLDETDPIVPIAVLK